MNLPFVNFLIDLKQFINIKSKFGNQCLKSITKDKKLILII
jgi:hypothetical protein